SPGEIKEQISKEKDPKRASDLKKRLSETVQYEKERRAALAKLLPMQRKDFYGLFKAMDGLPVTIRTLDPPLHEFLPKREELLVLMTILEAKGEKGLSDDQREQLEDSLAVVKGLRDFNGTKI